MRAENTNASYREKQLYCCISKEENYCRGQLKSHGPCSTHHCSLQLCPPLKSTRLVQHGLPSLTQLLAINLAAGPKLRFPETSGNPEIRRVGWQVEAFRGFLAIQEEAFAIDKPRRTLDSHTPKMKSHCNAPSISTANLPLLDTPATVPVSPLDADEATSRSISRALFVQLDKKNHL